MLSYAERSECLKATDVNKAQARRFAKPTCPVCARRFSRLFSDLTCSKLHPHGLICRLKCTKHAARKRHQHTSSKNGISGPEQLPVSRHSGRTCPCVNVETGRIQGTFETEAAYLVDERVGAQCLNSGSIMSE